MVVGERNLHDTTRYRCLAHGRFGLIDHNTLNHPHPQSIHHERSMRNSAQLSRSHLATHTRTSSLLGAPRSFQHKCTAPIVSYTTSRYVCVRARHYQSKDTLVLALGTANQTIPTRTSASHCAYRLCRSCPKVPCVPLSPHTHPVPPLLCLQILSISLVVSLLLPFKTVARSSLTPSNNANKSDRTSRKIQ